MSMAKWLAAFDVFFPYCCILRYWFSSIATSSLDLILLITSVISQLPY